MTRSNSTTITSVINGNKHTITINTLVLDAKLDVKASEARSAKYFAEFSKALEQLDLEAEQVLADYK